VFRDEAIAHPAAARVDALDQRRACAPGARIVPPADAVAAEERDVKIVRGSHPLSVGRRRITLPTLACIAILAWASARYPLGACWLAGGVVLYLAVLFRWPSAWLIVVPAALPVLDLANFTGRFFFDEFDCLLVATIAMGGRRWTWTRTSLRLSPTFLWLSLFAASTVAALLIGAYPYPAPGLNAFGNYLSPYNALRTAKGFLWALALLPLIKSELERNAARAYRLFSVGMASGLLAACVAVLWERMAFTGLFNFSSGYRVVGMFSGMHTGGASIEAYLVTAIPFAVWLALTARRWVGCISGIAVSLLGVYALMVTYARGGYIGLMIGMAMMAACFIPLKKSILIRRWTMAGGAALALIAAGAAWPVLDGPLMQRRFASTEHDLKSRTAHWREVAGMADRTAATTLFGMGLGRYPATYFWRNFHGGRLPAYGLTADGGNTYLTLGGGNTLFVEQIVELEPKRRYPVSFRARSRNPRAGLAVMVCEKWMLYSSNCTGQYLPVGDTRGEWREFGFVLETSASGSHSGYVSRPTKLSFFNSAAGSLLEIDDMSIRSNGGSELVRNGDFSNGMDRWFFTSDFHLAWHFENLWLQVYFEQGLIGVALLIGLTACAFGALFRRRSERNFPVPALAAALVGFLTVGVVNSLLDVPRIATMFYLLVMMAILHFPRREATGSG
jgi:hypothetical protein